MLYFLVTKVSAVPIFISPSCMYICVTMSLICNKLSEPEPAMVYSGRGYNLLRYNFQPIPQQPYQRLISWHVNWLKCKYISVMLIRKGTGAFLHFSIFGCFSFKDLIFPEIFCQFSLECWIKVKLHNSFENTLMTWSTRLALLSFVCILH